MTVFNDVVQIDARDIPEAWFLGIKKTMEVGHEYVIDRGSHQGEKRKEIDFITLAIRHPGVRPLVPDTPVHIPPPSSMNYVEQYLPYLMTGEKKPNEQYTYGEDIDYQLKELIRMYKEDGFGTNQACMNIGGRESIFLSDPQCLRVIDTRIRYGKLHFYVYFRSWDLWSGLPSNLAAIQLLKEYVADEIGVEDGELISCSKGLHLYEHHWKYANMLINR